ncbi:hypothetical protein SISSUDRAFT_667630 [Sistotremastrum suecicum HHB10207 ss-3]|uniref:Uncharacterized protein n=1 Tax=Sistotremastrum suecicum HHB10207 ss-3 TaxID=1314776 RepID=A0A166E4N5_9AGAM|nr:hypothetical protein SISSUDRAFT_667630 [Sistotremastrum suecicum HHB10207 ss-3]
MFVRFAEEENNHVSGELPDIYWHKHIHPAGWPYYHHTRDKVTTTLDITDPRTYRDLQRHHRDHARRDSFAFPNNPSYEHYLDTFNTKWEISVDETGYRWINHAEALGGDKDQGLLEMLQEVTSPRRYEHTLERRRDYWAFLQAHPCHTVLPEYGEQHVQDVLTWCLADQTLFSTSTASFTVVQAERLLEILKSLPDPSTRPIEENMKSYSFSLRVWYTAAIARTIGTLSLSLSYSTSILD